MIVRIICANPACAAVSKVEEQSRDRRDKCQRCGQIFDLARSGDEPASAMSEIASNWLFRTFGDRAPILTVAPPN